MMVAVLHCQKQARFFDFALASQPSYFPKYSLGVSPVIFLKRRVK